MYEVRGVQQPDFMRRALRSDAKRQGLLALRQHAHVAHGGPAVRAVPGRRQASQVVQDLWGSGTGAPRKWAKDSYAAYHKPMI